MKPVRASSWVNRWNRHSVVDVRVTQPWPPNHVVWITTQVAVGHTHTLEMSMSDATELMDELRSVLQDIATREFGCLCEQCCEKLKPKKSNKKSNKK